MEFGTRQYAALAELSCSRGFSHQAPVLCLRVSGAT